MNSIVVDRWDTPDLEQAREVRSFAECRAELAERFAPWGGDALDDIFWLLYKARPRLADGKDVPQGYVLGHVLVSLLARNPAVQRLRATTMRDLAGAALAAAQLAPQLTEAAVAAAPDPAGLEALEDAEREAAEHPDEEWLQDLADQRRQALADAAVDAATRTLEGFESNCEAIAEHAETRRGLPKPGGWVQGRCAR